MKIALQASEYDFITDNSLQSSERTAFVVTAQNKSYIDDAKSRGALTLPVKELAPIFGLDRVKIVGITGTNGKTTTAAAIYTMLQEQGYRAALLGTRGFFIDDKKVEGKSLTTPPVLEVYKFIYQAVRAKCDYFIMEVSSHAIVQERIEGIEFALKILTNITSDHLDFHKTHEEYVRVKNSFFNDESMKLINKDESKAVFNYKNAYTYSLEAGSSFKLLAYSLTGGISGMVQFFDEVEDFHSSLYGFFNLYNLLAAISAIKLLTKQPLKEICESVDQFGGVAGRMEVVSEKPLIIVDFAHTHDGMKEVLDSLREKDILVVFGAGGDRDKSKRPLMGKVASTRAKRLYVTSDNPRFEDPQQIVDDIVKGVDEDIDIYININRYEAIAKALKDREGDEVVLILGKGDETTQIIYDKELPFDDREVVKELLNEN